jgi:hypothetical protein
VCTVSSSRQVVSPGFEPVHRFSSRKVVNPLSIHHVGSVRIGQVRAGSRVGSDKRLFPRTGQVRMRQPRHEHEAGTRELDLGGMREPAPGRRGDGGGMSGVQSIEAPFIYTT